MKKIVIFICILFSFSFGKIQNQEFELEVVKIEKSNLEDIRVVLKFHNNSSRKIKYISMICSQSKFYLTNSLQVEIKDKLCDKNSPVILELESKSSVKIKLNLKCKTKEKIDFRIALKLFEMPEIIEISDDKKSTQKSVNVWTDNIKL